MSKRFLAALVGALAISLGASQPARANFQVRFTDSSAGGGSLLVDYNMTTFSLSITGSGNVANANNSSIVGSTFGGLSRIGVGGFGNDVIVGNFDISLNAEITNSPGNANGARLSISSIQLTNLSSSSGALLIETVATGYNLPQSPDAGAGVLTASQSGTAFVGGLASSYTSYLDLNSSDLTTPFPFASALSVGTGSQTVAGGQSLSTLLSRTDTPAVTGTYSLGSVQTVTLGANGVMMLGGGVTSFVVPEPSTIAMLLSGIPACAVGFVWRRRQQQA